MAQAAAPVRRRQRPAKVARAPAAGRSARHFDLVPASPRVRELRAMRSLQPAAADITTAPVVSLLAISAVLGLAGLVAFRRRNLALPV